MRPAHLANALLALLCALFVQGCSFGERDDVLILVRADDPISRAIGDYYAAARDIPAHRVLSLSLSAVGTRNEIDDRTFASEIATPIETYLAANDPDHEVSILVTTLGIPLRIGHCESDQPHYPRDCRSSAVDAALAGLGRLTSPLGQTGGRLGGNANPYFGDPRPFEQFRRDEPTAKLRFLVARLSGPAAPGVSGSSLPVALRELIDGGHDRDDLDPTDSPIWRILANAPVASRDAASRALIEPIHDLLPRNGHRICDGCEIAAESTPPSGVVLQQALSGSAAVKVPERLAFPGLVIALGSLPSDSIPFGDALGDWLARGSRAISMHLDDPSLGGVTRPVAQLRAWSEGRTVVEAHFSAVPHLGWTNVFVGDPLLTTNHPTKTEAGDLDRDGIRDEEDNCLDVANPDQRDSNRDGIGNHCDPDVDNDGRVDTSWGGIYPVDERGDLESIALTARNGPYDPDHDLDGDGLVDDRDLALAQLWLFRRPGPSGTH